MLRHSTRLSFMVALILLAATAWSQSGDPAEELYREGQSSLVGEDLRDAARSFRELHQRFPDSSYAPEALYWEAFSLYRLGENSGSSDRLEQALVALDSLRENYPDATVNKEASALATRVRGKLAQRGDSRAAREVTVEASRLVDDEDDEDIDDETRAMVLNALMQMDPERALPVLEKIIADRDESKAQLRAQATFVLSQYESAETENLLTDMALNDPDTEVRSQAIFWLSQVSSDSALDAIEQVLREEKDIEVLGQAVFALSQHQSERAERILARVVHDRSVDEEVRGNAIFWLGQSQSADAVGFLSTLYTELDSEDLKSQVIHAMGQLSSKESGDWLAKLMERDDEPMGLRTNALFWLSQRDNLEIATLEDLYGRFSDLQMREQILFALSQRGESEAVDILLKIARSERNLDLRKNAIFWLGQSEDPRVADFLEELIGQ